MKNNDFVPGLIKGTFESVIEFRNSMLNSILNMGVSYSKSWKLCVTIPAKFKQIMLVLQYVNIKKFEERLKNWTNLIKHFAFSS